MPNPRKSYSVFDLRCTPSFDNSLKIRTNYARENTIFEKRNFIQLTFQCNDGIHWFYIYARIRTRFFFLIGI